MPLLDVRLAVRALRRTPWLTATTVLVFALGIGGSTLVFSVVQTLLLKQLPYAEPDRLVTIDPPLFNSSLVEQVRKARAYERVGAYVERPATVRLEYESQQVLTAVVTDGLLDAIGVAPAVGRGFRAEEFQRGGAAVALLTDRLWRSEFGASANVIGQMLVIDDVPHTLVGVLPEAFRTLGELEAAADASYDRNVMVVVPGDHIDALDSHVSRPLMTIGRLRRGVSIEQAHREFAGILEATPRPWGINSWPHRVVFVTTAVTRDLPAQMLLLSVAVGILLLVACANIANLLLARGEGRRRELAIRAALGASTAALARSLLVEALLLSMSGGLTGILFAWAGLRALQLMAGGLLTRLEDLHVDGGPLGFAAVLSVAAGLLAGAMPAMRLSRTDCARWLHAEATTPQGRGRLPLITRLVVGQVALSVLLVVVGTLLARDFATIAMVDLGFRPHGVLAATITVERQGTSVRNADGFFAEVLARASFLPGVAGAALAGATPGGRAAVGGFGEAEGHRAGPIMGRAVTADYFSLLGIPLTAGRGYSEDDARPGIRTLVVGEEFARAYWGSASAALGKRVLVGAPGRPRTLEEFQRDGYTVVGVAADPKEYGWESRLAPVVYWLDRLTTGRQRVLLLRAANGRAASLAGPLRAMMRRLDPNRPLSEVRSLEDTVSARLVRPRLLLAMMAAFAALALVLASAGVHGMIAYLVALRRREFAIRLALGSTRPEVLRLVVGRTLKLLAMGIILGLPVTLVLIAFSAARIFAVTGADPLTCLGAVLLVVVVGLAASFTPAWRAARMEFVAALRED